MSTPTSANGDDLFRVSIAESAIPSGVDRRSFLVRNAVIGASAVLTGTAWTPEARAAQAAKEAAQPKKASALSPDLDVVKRSKGPVMTVLEEFYKVGPGPSSSHTIGPMRITYDFYQRCTKLPAAQLAQATGLKVHLFGSLSATGKGHGTERASLAGLIGKEPATVDPLFLDEMIVKPDQKYPVKLGNKTLSLSLADIIYDATKGAFPHPNTMTCKLLAGDKVLMELEYYSPGGGFYEWKGYTPPKKGQPKYPYATMKELREHAEKNKLSIAQVIMANEVAVSGKTEEQINAFLDKISGAMLATVKAGLAVKESVLPGPIKLHSKAAVVYERAMDEKYESDRAIALVSACAPAPATPGPAYRIQLGDELHVRFLYQPDMDEKLPVRPDGRISLVCTGEMTVVGLTAPELEALIKEKSSKRLRNPEVTVILTKVGEQRVYVGGEVLKPGFVPLRADMTPLQAVLQSGGFRKTAKLNSVLLLTPGANGTFSAARVDMAQVVDSGVPERIRLQPDTVVFVPATWISDVNDVVDQYVRGVIPSLPRVGVGYSLSQQ